MTYHYWTIRWVPDVVRGEFVNLGVLVGNDERQDWALEFVEDFGRASALGGDAARAASFLRSLRNRVDSALLPDAEVWGQRPLSFADVERLRAHQSNAVQLAAPRLLAVDSAAQGLQIIYPLMVEERTRRTRDTTRTRLVNALENDLRTGTHPELVTRRRTQARADGQRGSFDLVAQTPGHIQLAQAWSFTTSNVEYTAEKHQAWAWFVRMLRHEGGELQTRENSVIRVRADAPLLVIHDRPKTDSQRELFDSARVSWEALDIRAFEDVEMRDAVGMMRQGLALAG